MLFPTFDFLVFIIPALVGFWLLSERPIGRVLWLLFASYFFYMAGPKTEPPPAPAYFAGLLLFSTVLDFICGREIFKLDADMDSGKVVVSKLDAQGGEEWRRTTSFSDLDRFFDYLPERRQERVERRAKRKKAQGTDLKLGYLLNLHDVVEQGDALLVIGEAYYPEYESL